MNHLHVTTLVQGSTLDDALAVELAQVIATIWSRTLSPEGLVAEVVGQAAEGVAVTCFRRT